MLQWIDDFTMYGTDAGNAARMLNGPYAETTRSDLQADPDPTAGGKMVLRKFGGGLGGDQRRVLSAAQTTIGLAGRFWLPNLPTATGVGECPTFASFRDQNNVSHVRFSLNSAGNLVAYRSDNGGDVQIGITANPVVIANAWRHMEFKVVLDPAAGSIEARLEGQQVLFVNGIRTTSNVAGAIATCLQVAQSSAQDVAAPSLYMKDYIVWDGTGAQNNTFLGSCAVYRLDPAADVSLNWNPSAGGTGFNLINEGTPDDDGTYITAFGILSTPVNGALSATVAGALGAATYYVRSTWVNATGETLGAPETSLAVAANNVLNVAAPASPPPGATGWNVYVSTATGTETKQNAAPIGIAAAWVEPTTGLIAGAALPGANTTALPAPYICSLTQLPPSITSVKGVMPVHRSRKTDGGDGNIQAGLVSAASTGLGASRPITTAYTYWADILELDPNGNIAWTKTSVNNAKLQLNRTV